jgi:MFS family permease
MTEQPAPTPGGAAPGPQAQDSRSYAALRHPAARMYLIGAALAMTADSIEHVISYWMIYEKFQSPSLAGFAVIAHWVPFIFFSIWSGALADRYDPRRIIQFGMALFMLVSFGWGILFATDALEKWHAVVLLIVHGFAGVFWAPAGQVLIHDIVGERQLQSAIRLLATSRVLGLLLGPAIGGAMLVVLGPTVGIFLNVLIYLPLALWLVRNPKRVHTDRTHGAQMKSFKDMFLTVQTVAKVPVVFPMTLLAGFAAAFVGNGFEPQMPQFASDLLGIDADALHSDEFARLRYSMLMGGTAAGALIAGIVLEARNLMPANPRTAFILALMWCVAIFGFAISPWYWLSFALLLCAGFLDLSFNSMTRALAQIHAPPEIRGRAIGLFNVGALGGRTFSGFTVGFGGGAIGIHWSLALSAVALGLAIFMLSGWARRHAARVAPA